MKRNAHTNPIEIGNIFKMIIIAALAAMVALSYVWMKHQMHALGNHQKELERELEDLTTRNQVAAAQIAKLTSTASLQAQLAQGRLSLVPIPDQRIVRIHHEGELPSVPAPGSEMLPVVNQVAGF